MHNIKGTKANVASLDNVLSAHNLQCHDFHICYETCICLAKLHSIVHRARR